MTHTQKVVFQCPRFKVVNQRLDDKDYFYIDKADAVICIITRGEKYLFCRHFRPVTGTFGLELIGGRIEEREQPIDAQKREIFEEIGIDLEPKFLFTIDPLPSITTERVHVMHAEIEATDVAEPTTHGKAEGLLDLHYLAEDEIMVAIEENRLTSAAEGFAMLRFIASRHRSEGV